MNPLDEYESFTITCDKCESTDVLGEIYMDGSVGLKCNGCSNKEGVYE